MIEPVLIAPDALYDDGALRQALGLTRSTLAAARRSGALQFSRQGKRILYKGAWVLSWIESGTNRPDPRSILEARCQPRHEAAGPGVAQ
jgi:hypothetical protein